MPNKVKADKPIPIIDCPLCKTKDVPLSYVATFTKKNHSDVELWKCSKCGKLPNIANNIKIKRFISEDELKDMGWKQKRTKVNPNESLEANDQT